MSEDDKFNTTLWRTKLYSTLGKLFFLVLFFFGVGELVSDVIIFYGIEWLRVSTTSSLVIGAGGFLSVTYIESRIEKILEKFSKGKKE